MDCVIGKKTNDKVLLTLTERMTRKEIIRKMPKKNVKSVHKVLNQLKKEVPNFGLIFKSITTDNGSEFAKLHRWGKRAGVSIFYAHPYSSWERGLNENTNRIIRRFIQKGVEMKGQSKKRVQWIEDWINTMYRKSLGWKTADHRYQEEIETLLKSRSVECV
ncbi:IS30 family transposase [Mediterraneibacter gnavus]|nr:IS30 family transposase [Mediterraneibacter gnavus]